MIPLYIIDGHNLILTNRTLTERMLFDGKKASRDEAEDLILGWAEALEAVEVSLYYDGEDFPSGHPGNRDSGPLRVRFTDPPAEADDRIVFEATREVGGGRAVTVVTSDGGVANRLAQTAVKVIAAGDFLQIVKRGGPAPAKEERFTDGERRDLASDILAHVGEQEALGEFPPRVELPPRPPRPPARKATPPPPPIPAPPKKSKEAKREAYDARRKRKPPTAAKKSRKKKRGW